MNTRGVYIDDTKNTLSEFLRRATRGYLWQWTLAALLGTLITAGADFGMIIYVMRQGALDGFGHFTGEPWQLVAASCVTLALYWIVGLLLEHGCRKCAIAVYVAVVLLLCLVLPKTVEPMIQDLWTSTTGGALFGWQLAASPTDAPYWLKIAGTMFFALICTAPGLLFIYAKMRLWYWWDLWHERGYGLRTLAAYDRAAADRAVAREKAAERAYYEEPSHGNQVIKHWLRQGIGGYHTLVTAKRDAALKKLDYVTESKTERRQAEYDLAEAEKCLDSLKQLQSTMARVGACLVVGMLLALGVPSYAANTPRTTQEIIAAAPTFQLLLDASFGSPALDAGVMRSVLPLIDQKLRAMPIGTVVIVNSVGNASLMPLQWRTRIQARKTNEGAPVEDIIRGLHGLLAEFPKRMAGQEHQESHLIGAFFDAARSTNPQSQLNTVVMISDLIENSPLAVCAKVCKLPAPQFKLEGVEVNVYGVGAHLSSDRAMTLTQAWDGFFKKAKVKKLQLQRTF